jgi:hypothetical protein
MPVYSFGKDSPLKFELTDEFAEAYNRATDNFMEAQIEHKARTGKNWTPEEPIMLQDTTVEAFNRFGPILEQAQAAYGKPVHEDELTDDHLIKN